MSPLQPGGWTLAVRYRLELRKTESHSQAIDHAPETPMFAAQWDLLRALAAVVAGLGNGTLVRVVSLHGATMDVVRTRR